MAANHQIDITLLRLRDARDLAPLLAAYAQALKRGFDTFRRARGGLIAHDGA